MEEELNDLLTQAQENISDNVDKKNNETLLYALSESMKEIDNHKVFMQEFIDIRNNAIVGLYNNGYSAIKLAGITQLTRQQVHNIVKGK